MRILALCILFVIASCQTTTVSKEKLLGSWMAEQDESKYPKNGVLDKLTFFENDSFKVEMYLNGKLHDSFSGKYILDEKRKLITTKVDTIELHLK